jgi:hypothetical protein
MPRRGVGIAPGALGVRTKLSVPFRFLRVFRVEATADTTESRDMVAGLAEASALRGLELAG